MSVGGATTKNVLRDPETGLTYIAKLGGKNSDLEVMTEYAIFLIGRSLGVAVANARIARYGGQLRFLSQYFLDTTRAEELVHGMQLFKNCTTRRLLVGHLEFDGSVWTFQYDAAYKARHELRPIEGFDEIDRVYRSTVLFPFFAVRIPDIDRDDVQRRLEAEHMEDPETADLLRIFGRKALSSPAFELQPL